MKVLAVILLAACIYDSVRAMLIIEKGRKDHGIPLFKWSYLRFFKAVGFEITMNILAVIFFAIYLIH